MVQIVISSLPPLPIGTGSASPKGTDLTVGVDVTDLTEAATGTTNKYTRSEELNFSLGALGLTTYTAALVASTTALTVTYANGTLGVGATLTNAGAQAALVIDGVTLVVGKRVLIKDQVSQFQNGLYVVTNIGSVSSNWVLTRSLDYDEAADVVQYGVVLANQGTANAGLLYQETGPGPFIMGTTSIIFAQFQAGAISLPVLLADGGTAASLTADNGGIFYSNATTGAILAGTATAGQMLQSGASSTPSWTTSTWPTTTSVNQILFSSSSNVVGGITTANDGILVTSAAGVPSIGNTVGAGLTMPSVTFDSTTGIVGTTTNDAAASLSVGSLVSSVIAAASAVSLTTATPANVTSISLTAGDWDVWGNVSFISAATTNVVQARGWISETSVTLPDSSLYSGVQNAASGIVPVNEFGFGVPGFRISLASTTTVYLSTTSVFSVDTLTVCGGIYARRRR